VTLTLPLQSEMLRLFVYTDVSGVRQASDNICTIEAPSAASTSLAALGMLTISELDEAGVHLWTLEATAVGERYLADLLSGPPAAKVSRLLLAGERVLVVEDDKDSGDMLAFALRRAGAETRLSTSAEAARAVLAEWEPTIIVSDLMMPEENGFALIESIRADPRTRHIAAIALTGMAEDSARVRALSSGFQLHIVKPVNLDTLIRLMANLTGPIPTAA
jgi:CheY-like chemotaxis protein